MIITWHIFFPTSTTFSRLIVWYIYLAEFIINNCVDNADDGNDGDNDDDVDDDNDDEGGDTCMAQHWQHLQELLPSHRWMPLNNDDDDAECAKKYWYTNTQTQNTQIH